MLGDKGYLNVYKIIEIMQSMYSDHSGIQLELNSRGKIGKFTNMWKLTHTQWWI